MIRFLIYVVDRHDVLLFQLENSATKKTLIDLQPKEFGSSHREWK
jgi:hypothetical protein